MYELFLSKLPKDSSIQERDLGVKAPALPDDLKSFIDLLGGCSFGNGTYRTFTANEVIKYSQYCSELFFGNAKRYYFFGSNWNGCLFGLDAENNQVILFEPEIPEDYRIPCNIIDFHNNEIFNNPEAILRLDFLAEWKKLSNSTIGITQCVGYKKPLFLGGTDTVDNLELTDLEVYISTSGQLWNAIKDLPKGTKIGNIEIN